MPTPVTARLGPFHPMDAIALVIFAIVLVFVQAPLWQKLIAFAVFAAAITVTRLLLARTKTK